MVAIELSNNQAIQTADGGGLSAFDVPQWRSPLATQNDYLSLIFGYAARRYGQVRLAVGCYVPITCVTPVSVSNSIQSIVCPDCTSRYGYCIYWCRRMAGDVYS